MRCLIRIKLLSDMCVSDGGVYNSMLDTDICSTPEGFPYIPAKRLRGCLKECALELKEWGKGEGFSPEKLFGDKDDKTSPIRIGDAHLEGITEKMAQIRNGQGHLLFHRQNVLNHYSYIRTQTAIDSETGTADETSLRTMRVAAKGLVFISEADVREDLFDDLEECCKVLSGMGIGRTRGLGEVVVSLEKNENSVTLDAPELDPDADFLTYEIDLREPFIAKSVRGGQERSLDYLEGSKIFGYMLQSLKRREDNDTAYEKLSGVRCLDAFLKVDGKRGTEIPASFYIVKDEDETYINKAYETEAGREAFRNKVLKHMGHCYVSEREDGSLICGKVDIEGRYHHRRPDDKSIGRAYSDADTDSDFYQMSSISAGQTFCGVITGTPEQIKIAYEALRSAPEGYMGYARMSEYGLVGVRITGSGVRNSTELKEARHIRVSLNSPAIVYNNKAMYSTNAKDLLAEVCCALGIDADDIQSKEQYLDYTLISGYNVTWQARTPVVEGFDKGSTLVLHLKETRSLSFSSVLMIGERTGEGYGEVVVQALNEPFADRYTGAVKEDASTKKGASIILDASSGVTRDLADDLVLSFIRSEAVRYAKAETPGDKERPTVSNMLLMAEENTQFSGIKESVAQRYDRTTEGKREKAEIADGILLKVEEVCKTIVGDFEKYYGLTGYSKDKNSLQMAFLTEYLAQLKYLIRKPNQKGGQDGR